MSEKRDLKRHRKRLTLRFGLETPSRVAFTEDLSTHGMFIKTTNICPPGTRIRIELIISDSCSVHIDGMVRWNKKVPPQMIHLVKKSGMGVKIVKFLSGREQYLHLIDELHGLQQRQATAVNL